MPILPLQFELGTAGQAGWLRSLWDGLMGRFSETPELGAMLALAVILWIVALILFRRSLKRDENGRFGRQWSVVFAAVVVLLLGLLLLPIGAEARAQIVQVLGVVLPASIALSATALLGNALGGLVLQRTANFKLGDFISVGEHFGRVSERSLMNTEIQTADRDLVTLPNLMLVTQPVKVVRRSGTVVSATVSLGYELPWSQVQDALLEAGKRAELREPFVQVTELGDYSVHYRVAGLCEQIRSLMSVQANLRLHMLDCLHEADIEIMSPDFVNMRHLGKDAPSVTPEGKRGGDGAMQAAPTDQIFDKADKAQALSSRQAELGKLETEFAAAKGEERKALQTRLDRLRAHVAYLERLVDEEDAH